MVIENFAQSLALADSGDEDIAIVDNEDRIVKDDITMDEVEVHPSPTNAETPQINAVCFLNISLMVECTAQISKSSEDIWIF